MMLYEVWDAEESRVQARKYLVAARDTDQARALVNHKLDPQPEQLDVSYPQEDDVRQRKIAVDHGFWKTTQTCWEVYQECKRNDTARVITNYYC